MPVELSSTSASTRRRKTSLRPALYADPARVEHFWVNHAVENWQQALALEREHGLAVCDGDPFHLYYSWALWKSGALAKTLFQIESEIYRSAFEKRRVGFVDHVLWLEAPVEELRRRKRHETHLALVPWMKSWFQQRERILPGTVRALTDALQVKTLKAGSLSLRYDPVLLDGMLGRLRRM